MSEKQFHAPQTPARTGLTGRCPRCGEGPLFAGVTKIAPSCRACGLAYNDPGDGAAMFVILIGNVVILGLALWLEFSLEPPFVVHLLLWAPLSVGFCILALRLIKGLLVALQYRHRAAEGRLEP